MACLLCRRAFPSKEVLIKHQQMSDLHKVTAVVFLTIVSSLIILTFFSFLLGPFHWAIAVPSVTRCHRCRWRRGHRCAGGARQCRWRHLVNGREAARSSEWAQHFSNASCLPKRKRLKVHSYLIRWRAVPFGAARHRTTPQITAHNATERLKLESDGW